jgi:hypothetical protein
LYATGRGVLSRLRMDTEAAHWWKESAKSAADKP